MLEEGEMIQAQHDKAVPCVKKTLGRSKEDGSKS